ncbi:MAG: 16S rRNA (cytosine(1402)-N(4))-methyltransferase RsmH, partial [Hydrogenimonas sp.]|nr:16S rRNA (cytosine(1402)-N(4))-methyltransferase RsmH [Hydrogenimonas sp.]
HSEAILKRFSDIKLIGIDRDPEAIAYCKERFESFEDRFEAMEGRFSQLLATLLEREMDICGILADFGVSSLQLDKKERGFSFESDNLDMRMDSKAKLTAYEVVNSYPQEELERIFREYGEQKAYKRAAKAVVEARNIKPIESGKELSEIFGRVLRKRGRTNPATTLFQAIRIEVNDELGEIERLLDALESRPPKGAVVGLITFHSLEDRLVKRRFKEWSRSCVCPPEAFRCQCGGDHALGNMSVKKPLTAAEEEIAANPRSRSAKLRCFRFKD